MQSIIQAGLPEGSWHGANTLHCLYITQINAPCYFLCKF